jgi:capsular exopolysaccharide synthesis family protein
MGFEEIGALIWRRKVAFLAAFLVAFAALSAATLILPKTYEASATLLVGPPPGESATPLDTTQGEQLARTYSTLASNPGVADEVAAELGLDREDLLERMAFAPVERTQLVQITAEGDAGEEAADYANTYAEIFSEREAERAASDEAAFGVSVVEPAVPPEKAAKPNVPLYLGFGFALALLLALGVALLRDRLDRRIRVSADQEELLGLPIIGRLARGPLSPHVDGDPSPELADAIRVLRTNIELADGPPVKSIVVTSPGAGDGKSTAATHFAATIAGDGDRVALVEGDLRRPSVDLGGLAGGLARTRMGLGSYLADQASRKDVVRRDEHFGNLSVVYAGTSSAEPGRLLRSVRLPQLLDDLARHHEWVVIDAPPVLVSDDALVLLTQADAVLFVVDVRKTPLPAARAAIAQLRKANARIAGIVVNGVAKPRRDSYYYAAGVAARPLTRPRDEPEESEANLTTART